MTAAAESATRTSFFSSIFLLPRQEAQGPFDLVIHKATDQLAAGGLDTDGRVRFQGADTRTRARTGSRRMWSDY